MKLRQKPEDFKVEEINQFKLLASGSYKLYILEKKSIETFGLLSDLSTQNKIPVHEFGIAGLKDKHAVTKQYFTIPSKYTLNPLKEQDFNLIFLGYVDKKLELGDLQSNRFEIVVRDIKKGETDSVILKSQTITEMGAPNYFDSQRFGSVINKEFIAKYLVKKNYERAVKYFLTTSTAFEPRKYKEEKNKLLANWNNLSNLSLTQLNITNKTPYVVLEEYKKTKNWLSAYKKIPAHLREMFISAYQSYLWNECIKEILRKAVNNKSLYSVPYNIGSLLFYKKLSTGEMKLIPNTVKTISDELDLNKLAPLEKYAIEKVLAKEGITLKDFNIKQETGNFFKTNDRPVLLKPEHFSISKPLVDELNTKGNMQRYKFILNFSLPKGKYATIITKRLFNQ